MDSFIITLIKKRKMSKTFLAISALIGTIIGAGFLGIPYVVMKSGFSIGLFHLIFLAIVLGIIMLYLGEIVLRTKTNHQLPCYAEKYLGKPGKKLMLAAFTFGIYSAIIAYLIAEGESFSFIFTNSIQYQFIFGIAFWIVLSALSYFGLKALEEADSLGFIIIIILVISIIALKISKIDTSNLTYSNPINFFTPFGVILFAYLGFSVVPEMKRIFGKENNLMKKSIICAQIIAFAIYVIFTIVVLGFAGANTPQLSTLALGKPFILLGMITMFTSYITLSIVLIDTFRFDFHLSKAKSWLITIIIPLIAFIILELTNNASFTTILSVGGVISGGLTAILILFMVKNAKKFGNRTPEYEIPYSKILTWFLILVFIIGAILEIINVIK